MHQHLTLLFVGLALHNADRRQDKRVGVHRSVMNPAISQPDTIG
jgi:hypothetical protein